MIVGHCQRWRDRRGYAVPAASRINPAEFSVDVLEEAAARPFVIAHHYSGTFPAARLSVGLFRGSHLVGAAVFSVPMNNSAVPHWTGLKDPNSGAELGRLVLLDEVAAYGESWFMARALSRLRAEKPQIEGVLSYSDPVERRDAAGRLLKPGHVGIIYQALSARYRGLTGRRTGYMTPDGAHLSGRALSKLRLGEQGADYAAEQLLLMGAPALRRGESGRAWLDRLAAEGWLRRYRHPGNHAYVFPLTMRARRRCRRLDTAPYPKLVRA